MSKIHLLYILTLPVDSALVSHSRSLSLNGSRMRLTPGSRSTALSGYMMWCVVRFPTSFSKPRVIALFILKKEEEVEKKGVSCVWALHASVLASIWTYRPDYEAVRVDQFTVARISQVARVANNCTFTTEWRVGICVHSGWGNDLEHFWHHAL